MPAPITSMGVALIVAAANAGKSVSEMSRELGFDRGTITRVCKQEHIGVVDGRRSRHQQISQEEIDKIVQMAKDGYYQHQIAETVGVSLPTVRKHMKLAGISAQNKWGDSITCPQRDGIATEPKTECKDPTIDIPPVETSSLVEVNRIVTFAGAFTGSRFSMNQRKTEMVVRLVFDGGQQSDVEFTTNANYLRAIAKEFLEAASMYDKIRGGNQA